MFLINGKLVNSDFKFENKSKIKISNYHEEKFSGNEDVKLPQIANEAEKLSRKAGIGIDFLLEETKHLIDSIEKYVKALKKAGI